jgi:hypothetical protein
VDELLSHLIAECRDREATLARRKALNRLLGVISQLPGIYTSSHQDYPEAFNRTLEWVCKNIERFEARSPSLQDSFVTWINGYLHWRIRDLYLPDDKYETQRTHTGSNLQGEAIDLIERLADPKSLNLLDLKIAQIQENKRQRQGEIIREYIERDPDRLLTNCCLKKHEQCHCQLLAIRLLLQEPSQRIADLSRELNISNQTLYSHWKQKCLPLLQEIGRRFTNPT